MYDKSGEEHYNLISALHKSVRNSDPDAALYWLARMFAAGEDPLYLARRVVRMAVEDIGLAAPEALNLCLSAKEAIDFLGSPEGDLALAEAVVYLCLAPKSNSVYTAYGAVQEEIEHTRQEPVPLHLLKAPTRLMKELGYAKGYRYAHNEEDRLADMDCLPESLKGRSYYHPTQEGREKQLAALRAPDAVPHVGVGGIGQSRPGQIAKILLVLFDLPVPAGKVERDLRHIVDAGVSDVGDLESRCLDPLADSGEDVVGSPFRRDADVVHAQLSGEGQVFVGELRGQLEGDLDARRLAGGRRSRTADEGQRGQRSPQGKAGEVAAVQLRVHT